MTICGRIGGLRGTVSWVPSRESMTRDRASPRHPRLRSSAWGRGKGEETAETVEFQNFSMGHLSQSTISSRRGRRGFLKAGQRATHIPPRWMLGIICRAERDPRSRFCALQLGEHRCAVVDDPVRLLDRPRALGIFEKQGSLLFAVDVQGRQKGHQLLHSLLPLPLLMMDDDDFD